MVHGMRNGGGCEIVDAGVVKMRGQGKRKRERGRFGVHCPS